MNPQQNISASDALMASLLSLMTSFSCLGCPNQAIAIQHQLAMLQSYPDEEVSPSLKFIARQLESKWCQLYQSISDEPDNPVLH